MSLAIRECTQVWTRAWMGQHPVRTAGIFLHLLFRTLFGLFWLMAGINKINKGWITESEIVRDIFLDRLTEMPPDAFAVFYLENFAIPMYVAVAWVVTVGEIVSAVGLLLGLLTRSVAVLSFFILFNLAIGGYYDASLIPFFLLNLAFIYWPSGLWLGFDRPLAKRYPHNRWFR